MNALSCIALQGRAWIQRTGQRWLTAWPGVMTLVSLLAVLMGAAPSLPPVGEQVSAAGRVTPALPELRPVPAPGAPTPMTAGTPPEPLVLPRVRISGSLHPQHWSEPARRTPLSVLGRRQTDGG